MDLNEEYNLIGYDIIGAAFDVMKNTGNSLREIYYQKALAFELRQRGHQVKEQVVIPAIYRGNIIDSSYLADMVVDEKVIIEIKALTTMKESECRQLLTYLKLSDYRLGYLINFGSKNFVVGHTHEKLPYKNGIYRFINNI